MTGVGPPPLRLEVKDAPGRRLVKVGGELDLFTTARLREVLWEDQPGALLVLDLSEVGFLDAYAVRTLIAAHRRSRARGGQLVVTGVHDPAARVLALTRADRVLQIRAA